MDNVLLQHPLPQLTAHDVVIANSDVRLLNAVFEFSGVAYTVSRVEQIEKPHAFDVLINGKRGTIALSESAVNALLSQYDTNLTKLDSEWVMIILQTVLTHHVEKKVQILGVVPTPQSFKTIIGLCPHECEKGMKDRYAIGIGTDSDFDTLDLFDASQGFCVASQFSPLANVPVALPLIATAIDVNASELAQLAVGDILLVGV